MDGKPKCFRRELESDIAFRLAILLAMSELGVPPFASDISVLLAGILATERTGFPSASTFA
jgi:hypothetical protein